MNQSSIKLNNLLTYRQRRQKYYYKKTLSFQAETKEQQQKQTQEYKERKQEALANKEQWAIDEDNCAYNIGEYCTLDLTGKRVVNRSVGEMELQFLQALREFYFDGESQMSNEEFDQLKDELLWSGSKVARLSSDEQRFLEATAAHNDGKPIMTDEEYDGLKGVLRLQSSWVATQGPRCSLRTQTMYSDTRADYFKMTLLNIPAAITVLFGTYAVDALTDFKITQLIESPQPWGIFILWGGLLPAIFFVATQITQVVFKDNMILQGLCPNCGAQNESYFGDILNIRGSRDVNLLDCKNCRGVLEFNNISRMITYDIAATNKRDENEKKRKQAAEARKNKGQRKIENKEQEQTKIS